MRSTFNLLCYINRKKVNADGTTTVMCRISIDGKNSALTTGINCLPQNWNSKTGTISVIRDNKALNRFLIRVENMYESILKKQGVVSSEMLKNAIIGINSLPTKLLQAGIAERERLEKRSVKIKSNSTFRQSKATQSNLQSFIRSREMEDIAFSDITEEFAESFKIFLKKEKNYKLSSINRNLCWLNRLIYIAVDQDILKVNPIEDVKYEKNEPPNIKYISKGDLKRIMGTPMKKPMVELARRAFIFSSFTGLAYVDVCGLYPHHIGKTSAGRLYIRAKRVKTKVEFFVPLHPVAEKILSFYNTTDNEKPIFPLPDRNILWHKIHQVGIEAGLKEGLSYHQGRHSFGTMLLSAGVAIESIAKMMGHSDISSTQIYAIVTDDKISDDVDKLIVRRTMKDSLRNKSSFFRIEEDTHSKSNNYQYKTG